MSFAEKVRVLKEVNAAYAKTDALASGGREARVRARRAQRAREAREAARMVLEDDASAAVELAHRAAHEAVLLAAQRKKNEKRLMRELAARLGDDDAGVRRGPNGKKLPPETFLQRQQRLRDRQKLMARDALRDAKKQARTLDEGNMFCSAEYLVKVPLAKLARKRLLPTFLTLSKAQSGATQLASFLSRMVSPMWTDTSGR